MFPINLQAKGIEITPAIQQYVDEKFRMLEKFAHDILQIDVHVGKDTEHHQKGDVFTCAGILQVTGDVLKIERSEDDLYKAIDKVKDHFRETLSQRKERMIDRRKES